MASPVARVDRRKRPASDRPARASAASLAETTPFRRDEPAPEMSGPYVVLAMTRNGAGAVPLPIALEILIQIADALDHAHDLCDEGGRRLELVHRDVSLMNIIISRTATGSSGRSSRRRAATRASIASSTASSRASRSRSTRAPGRSRSYRCRSMTANRRSI